MIEGRKASAYFHRSVAASLTDRLQRALLPLLLCVALVTHGEAGADEGIWAGKWDDTWPVFIFLKRDPQSNTFSGRYYWLEKRRDQTFSVQELEVSVIDGYFTSRRLSFKLDNEKGILHGNFEAPRMANLVRIHDTIPSVENFDEMLAMHGWKPGAIPAEEALEQIKQ